MPPTLVKGIKLGGKNCLDKKDTRSESNVKTTWLNHLDMVRFDRDKLQAKVFKCFMDKGKTNVLDYRSTALLGMHFHILSSSRL